ncbi:YafY family transcriptional regulator [Alphaproteobacteria bacterium KMM 3653]|uniref:YafY family transcriptional regulator n=1 Tax=Harenicola maris TaxID=2841044 RepID=A0AAP2CTS9_9RHOB|nr:YafY family transcriptional regulator [Harenicola maris]
MSRTHRLFHLMQLMRRMPPPVTAAQLGAETGVSARSIHRDIDTLRELGAVIDGAAGYGYTLTEDAALPPLMFEAEEIEALVLGLREVQAVGDPDLAQAAGAALAKLGGRLPPRQAHRLKNAVLNARRFRTPPAPGVNVRILREATWDETEVIFDYTDAKGAQTQRQVRPLSIVSMDAAHCLLAWCVLRQDFRAFRLDRMGALQVTSTSFRPARIGLLRDYLEQISCDSTAETTRSHQQDAQP